MADPKGPCEEARQHWMATDEYWGGKAKAYNQLAGFLAGDRYNVDNGQFTRDRRLQQIIGQEIQDTIRHNVAEATSKPRDVTTRTRDGSEDDGAGEIVNGLIERLLDDPFIGFEGEYEDALFDAHAIRLGVVWMDHEPAIKGQITFGRTDPRNIRWDPCYTNPHHPLCGWLHRAKRIDADRAKKLYGKDWIQPDREAVNRQGGYDQRIPILQRANGDRLPEVGNLKDNKATIWEWWYKDAYASEKPYKPTPLAPEDQYMACGSGCGHRMDQQEFASAFGQGVPMPEMMPPRDVMSGEGGCPTCGGPMERVDVHTPEETARMSDQGKRLVVMAPFSPAPDDEPIYDGGWPIPSARSYPALFLTRYSKPGDPVGPCDVDFMWPQQVAADNLRTIALQRIYEHRDYWKMPAAGIEDYKGDRFEFRDDQFNVMYVNAAVSNGPVEVVHENGTGLDPSFPLVFNLIESSLTQFRGVADFGLTQDNSKDIPASSLAQITTQQNIPSAHFARRRNRALGMFYGVVEDYKMALLSPDEKASFALQGADMSAYLHGQDFPRHDFIVEDTPEYTGLEKAKAEAFEKLMGVYQQAMMMGLDPQALIEVFVKATDLPKSIVRDFSEMIANRPPMMGMGGPVPGASGPGNPGASSAPAGGPPDTVGMQTGPGMGPQPLRM